MVPEKPGQEVGAGSASSPATQQAPTLTGRCGPCGSRAASAGLSPPGSARPSPPCAGCWPHTACATGLGDPVPPRTHPGQAWPRLTVQRKYGKDQGTRPEKQAPAPACPGRHGNGVDWEGWGREDAEVGAGRRGGGSSPCPSAWNSRFSTWASAAAMPRRPGPPALRPLGTALQPQVTPSQSDALPPHSASQQTQRAT